MQPSTHIVRRVLQRLERLLLGREKSPLERGIFHRLSLIAFFAWVGLGADGLSSSCYGPEEAYLALQGHHHLAVFLALATAITVAVIAASYAQIIERFPGGGGGYVVATSLLSPTAGVISGCALVVDYVLTIAVSVASGVDALLSFGSHADSPHKSAIGLLVIAVLVMLNLRGVKESVRILLPIFILFVVTHAILIATAVGGHSAGVPAVFQDSISGTRESIRTTGLWATIFLFLRAYSLGAGTYTGIEAVSNGMAVLREPRVRTGKRTMLYMALSLAITAAGILLAYRLFDIEHEAGRTLNATLTHRVADGWDRPGLPWGSVFVALTLLSEGALLFVAAQTGFLGGPRMLAAMAVDRWVPNRFANLSGRLVTGNGILLMGTAAAVALLYTRSSVKQLVIMYSINVFVTFTLSQLGMVRHWWAERTRVTDWMWRLLLNGSGMLICFAILVVTVSLKFFQGGWLTVVVTGSTVGVAFLVRRHYRRFQFALTMLNLLVENSQPAAAAEPGQGRTAGIFVNRYDGLGLHTLGRVRALMGTDLRKVVFLSVVQVDSDQFRDEAHLFSLTAARRAELERYEVVAREAGLEAASRHAIGTDVVEELETLAVEVAAADPQMVFVAGQVVFQQETLTMRLLHNEVAFALQRRLLYRGLDIVIVPVQLPSEVW
jgi:amino acid transporter